MNTPMLGPVGADHADAARNSYLAALDARETACRKAAEAGQAVDRGAGALEAAKAAHEPLARVPATIAEHRAAALRAGTDGTAPLPPDLEANRTALRDTEDLIRELRTAHDQLAADHDGALAVRAVADAVLLDASRVQVAHEVLAKVERFEALEREAAPLRALIRAYLTANPSWQPGNPQWRQAPPAFVDRLTRLVATFPPPSPDELAGRPALAATFDARVRALMAGAEVG